MAEPIVSPSVSGQELQLGDVDNIGSVSGLADDRVLAEFLRMAPYDGTNIAKVVLPFDQGGVLGAAYAGATVVTTNSANGSVYVNPFRAIVGSRNLPNAAPNPNPAINYQSDALANWRDIRSGIFVGSTTTLQSTQAFAANSSGWPRWDLVYASISVDASGPTASRRVKTASSGSVGVQSVAQWLASPVTVGIVQGATNGTNSPVLPSPPTDSGSVYNFPLAHVRIVNGFTTTSTLSSRDIRSYATTTSRFRKPYGGAFEPCTGNNDLAGSYATNYGWAAQSSGTRPGPVLPPDWVGPAAHRFFEVDATTASPSHVNTAIVDNSIDWRNRMILAFVQPDSTSNKFGNDPTAGTTSVPYAPGTDIRVNNTGINAQMAGTFTQDAGLVAASSTVWMSNHTYNAGITAGVTIGLYVLASDGVLRWYVNGGVPGVRVTGWLIASPPFPNY